MKRGSLVMLLAMAAVLFAPLTVMGQDAPSTVAPDQTPTIDETLVAGEAGAEDPTRKLITWNEYDGKHFTLRVGGGFLYEYGAFAQDDDSKRQLAMYPDEKVRDARILLKGRLKFFKRPVTYTMGIMYDVVNDQWVARQTGIMVDVPEIWGQIFVGRTKEGFSLTKVMTGYSIWAMERFPMNDATVPILADGVKWFGHDPKQRFVWNLGIYKDWMSQNQGFSTYDHQVVGRVAWLPEMADKDRDVLHLGLGARYAVPKDKKLQNRSRPEANTAPYFLDTGKFDANNVKMLGPEIYYRRGSMLMGSEYFVEKVDAPASGDPYFHGGDVFISWMATGEVRSYNVNGGFFNGISPSRSVYDGGMGAWELVARFSYTDFDSGPLRGGKFWRFTPMVHWHLSDHIRLEMVYGTGTLNRFNLYGGTHFFQSRLQLQL